MIDGLLGQSIKRDVKTKRVAVLLSGGMDSFSVAVSAHRLGKKVHAYTFQLEGKPNPDSIRAQHIAETFGWPITVCEIPHEFPWGGLSFPDFHYLCLFVGCRRKVEFEVCYPFLFMFDAMKNEKYILSGWGADGWYGLSRKAMQHWRHDRNRYDEERKKYFSNNPGAFNQMRLMMEHRGKTFVTPYTSEPAIAEYFLSKDWWELNDSVSIAGSKQKGLTRLAYKPELDRVGRIKRHANLQKESGVSALFADTLKNPRYNITDRKDWVNLSRDWSRMSGEDISKHRKEMREEQWRLYGETEKYWVTRLSVITDKSK